MEPIRSERGSLPLVLLAAIILAGVLVALFVTVRTGVEVSGRDRDFAQAIQTADAGIQEAFVGLRQMSEALEMADDPSLVALPCDNPVPGSTHDEGECEGRELHDGSTYRWRYERPIDDLPLWEVHSDGEYRSRTRTVRAVVGQAPRFPASMIADTSFVYNGGGTGTSLTVGIFGYFRTTGTPSWNSVDEIFEFSDEVTYDPSGNVSEEDIAEKAIRMNLNVPVLENNEAVDAFEPDGVCNGGEVPPQYQGFDVQMSMGSTLQRDTIYCLSALNISSNLNFSDPGADGPAVVYVDTGGVSISGNNSINAAGDPADLQIYVKSGAVTFQGTPTMRSAIWAPNSACTGGGTPNYEGSIVCKTINLNGDFGFDERVLAILDGNFTIRNWGEEFTQAAAP